MASTSRGAFNRIGRWGDHWRIASSCPHRRSHHSITKSPSLKAGAGVGPSQRLCVSIQARTPSISAASLLTTNLARRCCRVSAPCCCRRNCSIPRLQGNAVAPGILLVLCAGPAHRQQPGGHPREPGRLLQPWPGPKVAQVALVAGAVSRWASPPTGPGLSIRQARPHRLATAGSLITAFAVDGGGCLAFQSLAGSLLPNQPGPGPCFREGPQVCSTDASAVRRCCGRSQATCHLALLALIEMEAAVNDPGGRGVCRSWALGPLASAGGAPRPPSGL